MYLSVHFEKKLFLTMNTLTKWRAPTDGLSIRFLKKAYLNKEKITHKRFTDNMPDVEWVCSFIKWNNLTKRIANNVKATRAKVSKEMISTYFNDLEQSLNLAVDDVTPSGKFDNRTFEIWFFKWFVPAGTDRGKVALIGGNLSSHFSKVVIDKCLYENISFICVPLNATHLCQPLDVAISRPIKPEWQDILVTGCKESRSKEKLTENISTYIT